MSGRCSPLAATITLLDRGPDGATGTVRIGADDPVFAGHYPGFPVLPGVYLVELVEQAVRDHVAASAGSTDLELIAIDRCRFIRPVYPDDEMTVRTAFTRSGTEVRCVASVSTAHGPAAELRVRYGPGADR